jgi:hypothetical protein
MYPNRRFTWLIFLRSGINISLITLLLSALQHSCSLMHYIAAISYLRMYVGQVMAVRATLTYFEMTFDFSGRAEAHQKRLHDNLIHCISNPQMGIEGVGRLPDVA